MVTIPSSSWKGDMQNKAEDLWKKDIYEKFKTIFLDGRVLEIGAGLSHSRPFFPGTKEYLGLDVVPSVGVNIISIAHEYKEPDGSFDVVCSFSSLEHDMYWKKTLVKMVELTRYGGLVLFSCCFNWKEHGTKRTSPEQSYNTQISEEWANYYENRNADDIKKVWNVDKIFSEYYLGLNPYDDGLLCFWGIKK